MGGIVPPLNFVGDGKNLAWAGGGGGVVGGWGSSVTGWKQLGGGGGSFRRCSVDPQPKPSKSVKNL